MWQWPQIQALLRLQCTDDPLTTSLHAEFKIFRIAAGRPLRIIIKDDQR
jgi:hypothetical protein